ncbi:MAG: type II secretion system F family protein [Planctomycetes bacterium]|nr:type II secretion system F family protein [Planctomycetota bacterium]
MLLITLTAVFLGVTAAVGGIILAARTWQGSEAEGRLGTMAQANLPNALQATDDRVEGLALRSIGGGEGSVEQFVGRFINLQRFIDHSGVPLSPGRLLAIMGGLALVGAILGSTSPIRWLSLPVCALVGGAMPLAWLYWKRRARLNRFEAQFPEAVDLLARSLRAGHSLADGIHMIGTEMAVPIRDEFNRCYERQNLGVALEQALEEIAERVPNVDLRFFVTAMVMQRETGGDTVELLEKISRLVRERFQLRGQVKALTAEGRLSGIVLLALPVLLSIYMYFRNPEYLLLLIRDPMGQQMVAGAVVLQLLGAVVIKKVVDIRV